MKKTAYISCIVFILFACLLININKSIAATQIKGSVTTQNSIPKWEEFCPKEYLAVDKRPSKLEGFSLFVHSTSNVSENFPKWTQHSYIDYWAKRRKKFDSKMNACLKKKNNFENCYAKVRQTELEKQASWEKFQQFYINAHANAAVYEVQRQKEIQESKEQFAELSKEFTNEVLPEVTKCIIQKSIENKFNTNNTNNADNYNSSNNTNYNKVNNTNSDRQKDLKIKSCQIKCDIRRQSCERAAWSAPTFGLDMSMERNKNLIDCKEEYIRCIKYCSG